MGALTKMFAWFEGRTTFFLFAFFISGNILHWVGKLDTTYLSFMGLLMTFVLGHSIKCDVLEPPQQDLPAGRG